jgi:hypothetical protein
MGLISALKWMWDPTSDEDKKYKEWNKNTPLQRHTQDMLIYIKGVDTPFHREISFEDADVSEWLIRCHLDYEVRQWLAGCGTKGVKMDNVWYAPSMIERIELTERRVETIE